MKKIDLLYEVYTGKLDEDEADELLGKAMEIMSDATGFLGIELGTEWTALCFNHMPYKVIAKWRYEGWPRTCIICGENIDISKGRWWSYAELELFGKAYNNVMVHVDCHNEAVEWN